MVSEKVANIIEALGQHQDIASVEVLERVGTQSEDDEVRELTAKALVRKNIEQSLRVVLICPGKGVNDLSTRVAMSTINEIIELEDKSCALKVLENTIEKHNDPEIRDTARSVKALLTFCA